MCKKTLQEVLKRVNNSMKNLKKGDIVERCPIGIVDMNTWEWPQGVALYCEFLHYKKSGDAKSLEYLVSWFENRIKEGIPEKNINTCAPMLTLAYVYEETGDKKWLDLCNEWVEAVMTSFVRTNEGGLQHVVTGGVNNQQLWDDTLFMTVLFLGKMGMLLDNDEYKQEAEYQFLLHTKYLCDTKTGLWFHGWTFDGNHNFANALWARGNCWITAGVPLFIEMMNLSGAVKRFLSNVVEEQVKALVPLQAESGLWHTLLDDSNSYEESSSSAGFAFGILKSIHMGILDKKYLPIANKAVDAVVACIDEDGTVQKVSYGTGMGSDLDHYRNIPITPMAYGQSLTLLMLNEVLI